MNKQSLYATFNTAHGSLKLCYASDFDYKVTPKFLSYYTVLFLIEQFSSAFVLYKHVHYKRSYRHREQFSSAFVLYKHVQYKRSYRHHLDIENQLSSIATMLGLVEFHTWVAMLSETRLMVSLII
jgi:hypothetical protein